MKKASRNYNFEEHDKSFEVLTAGSYEVSETSATFLPKHSYRSVKTSANSILNFCKQEWFENSLPINKVGLTRI